MAIIKEFVKLKTTFVQSMTFLWRQILVIIVKILYVQSGILLIKKNYILTASNKLFIVMITKCVVAKKTQNTGIIPYYFYISIFIFKIYYLKDCELIKAYIY